MTLESVEPSSYRDFGHQRVGEKRRHGKRACSRFFFVVLLGVFVCAIVQTAGAPDKDIAGVWTTEDGKAKVDVVHCGDFYCGKISWLGRPLYPIDDPKGMGGQPRVDRENPDPAQRSRPLLGMQIMEGFRYSGPNTLDSGTIYDPESGKTYKGKIEVISSHRLELRGYVGIPLFGRTTTWTR